MDCARCTRLQRFICIEAENPIPDSLLNRRILLGGVALPLFYEHSRTKQFRDLDRAIGRARVHDDDLALAIRHQGLDAQQSAPDICFFVMRDDDDGERHACENTRHCWRWESKAGPSPSTFLRSG